MRRLLLATRNSHKTREFQGILGPDFELRDLTALSEIPDIIESGRTFEENAALKAIAVSRECDGIVLADDSGLEVDALGGAPGIYSARYAAEDATDKQNIAKLLSELARKAAGGEVLHQNTPAPSGASQTTLSKLPSARFRCAVALGRDGKLRGTFSGTVEGVILDRPRGESGFGYDPIFLPHGFGQTFGELPAEIKNRISHRAKAIARLRSALIAGKFDQ